MIQFLITGQQLNIVTPIVVADSHNYQTAAGSFKGDEWEDCTKWAHFILDDTTYDIPFHSDKITADQNLDLTAGTWKVYITGHIYDEEEDTVVARITTNTALLKVEAAETDSPFPPVTPSFSEVLSGEVERALQLANGVRTDVDAGLLNGATFTPTVSSDGNLSWTNDKGLGNPATVNIKGEKGDTGATGQPGADGYSPSAKVEEVQGGVKLTIKDKQGETSAVVMNGEKGEPGPQGAPGPKGDTGAGFVVKGYYSSASGLDSIDSPAAGDAYGVGTAEPYDIYIYDGVNETWVNNGSLQGAKGEPGPQGVTGPQGPTGEKGSDGFSPTISLSAESNGVKIEVINKTGTLSATVLNGTKGDTGASGATFTPSVSPDGDLSWTNDKDLGNPATVNIKGEKGDTPQKGVDYFTDEDKQEIASLVTASSIGAVAEPSSKEEGDTLIWNGAAWQAVPPTGSVSSVNDKTGAVVTRLVFNNVSIEATAFVQQSTPTVPGYPWAASKALNGATVDMIPLVVFGTGDAISGNLAPVADSYSGGIYIYARKKPAANISIQSVVLVC